MHDDLNIEEEYNQYRKNINLPEFAELYNYFEINEIQNSGTVLQDVARQILEKFETYRDILEEVIQPDSHPSSLYECSFVTDKDKGMAFAIYKKFMVGIRSIQAALLDSNNENAAVVICECFAIWKENHANLGDIILKLKGYWQKEGAEEEKTFYTG